MKRSLGIARREFGVYFDSPIGYIFLVAFLVWSTWNFFFNKFFFLAGQATMREFFAYLPTVYLLFVPAVSMRLWAEERRAGTDELLLTLPLRPWEIVFGKFLAALGLLAIALLCSTPLAFTVSALGPLDWGPVIGGYFGALMLGAACLAVGLFVSSLTRNQIVASIFTAVILVVFHFLGSTDFQLWIPQSLVPFADYASLSSHYESAARGVIDLRDMFYYAGFAGLFLYLNAAVLMWRKWN